MARPNNFMQTDEQPNSCEPPSPDHPQGRRRPPNPRLRASPPPEERRPGGGVTHGSALHFEANLRAA